MSTEKTTAKGFKRINFFKGSSPPRETGTKPSIPRREAQAAQPAAARAGRGLGYGGDLRVVARARGDLSVEVQPATPIDGRATT
jgi:hypothetical protein